MSAPDVIIVTGASKGIGREICLHLLRLHHTAVVIGIARSLDALTSLQHQAGAPGRLHFIAGDVASEETQAAALSLARSLGRLTALINNAAVVEPSGGILSAGTSQWHSILATNLLAPISLISRCMSQLEESKGRIINITSSTSQGPVPGFGAYGVTKVALNYATKALSLEHPDVTSVAFYPGVVDTEMNTSAMEIAQTYAADSTHKADVSHVIRKLTDTVELDLPCRIIANLALRADHSLSGRYIVYSDEEMASYST
ncbi:NAD(P)-binding protein [Martensiomyces pterosporus]|nr:NAD(P)-binding protein [Martensiomyces pterosporus]